MDGRPLGIVGAAVGVSEVHDNDGLLELEQESADHDHVLGDGQGVEAGVEDPDPLFHDPADDKA